MTPACRHNMGSETACVRASQEAHDAAQCPSATSLQTTGHGAGGSWRRRPLPHLGCLYFHWQCDVSEIDILACFMQGVAKPLQSLQHTVQYTPVSRTHATYCVHPPRRVFQPNCCCGGAPAREVPSHALPHFTAVQCEACLWCAPASIGSVRNTHPSAAHALARWHQVQSLLGWLQPPQLQDTTNS